MEAILKYNMDEPEDVKAHLRAVNSLNMALLLWDIKNDIRSKAKYGTEDNDLWYKFQEDLHDMFLENNVLIDELL